MFTFAPSTCVECGTDGQNNLTWGAQKGSVHCLFCFL